MKFKEIKKMIASSKNPEQAKDNFNFLLNMETKKLTKETISQVLAITEQVNNGRSHVSKHYTTHYGFEGGQLTKDSLNNILKAKYKDDMLAVMMMAMDLD